MTTFVPRRVDDLERLLGDPADPTNPVGTRAVLEADERAEMLEAGEKALHVFGLNAEFVPPEYGGRLTRVDHLVEVMRAVHRRDPALALGYGASSFIAGVNIWTASPGEQAARVARSLLSGGRVAVAFHELAHGNDMAGTEFTAAADGADLLLNGRKEVVTNIRRAQDLLVLARTDPRPGPRSHSLVLVDRASTPGAGIRDLPRFLSVGMRGVQLGGLEFTGVRVPATAVLGPTGAGLEIALKALQITRTALPAMATGGLDTALRTAIAHLSSRTLYGGAAIDIPHVRSVLVGVFADLLRAEAISAVGIRALHLVPGSASVYSAAVKYAVSKVLLDAMDRLAELLGAHFYLRGGPTAIFQKLLRDLAPVGFGHIARAACQMSVLPQLPLLARRSWLTGDSAPADLFALDAALPALRYDRLALHAAGRDPLAASLAAALDEPWDSSDRQLRAVAETDLAELTSLAGACAALPMTELGVDAPPEAYDLADRYIALLGRISCLQVRRHATDPFLADSPWLLAALHRSHRNTPLAGAVEDALHRELLDRFHSHRSFGLAARTLTLREENAR
ncbi:acyl-CoA dehydrogenase family protein [Streptomyces xylophagus]|uniref:acyl-CoA dehydrogenase family protein n=1 Tax=Streptomyces xylophagus TaxID=285514 RepID=UPI0005BD866C|nr:acyl-CoA dehydrogenase family protein [Streptomyces xylophagus]